jgi:hypothetical protein
MGGAGFIVAAFIDAFLVGMMYVVMWIFTGQWSVDWSFSNWWTRLSIVVGIIVLFMGMVYDE